MRTENELDDIERRILKWTSAFETGDMPADIGLDRVRELRARRRFQQSLRELFFEESTLSKHYLRFLVEAITVLNGNVTLRARREAVLQMIAAGGNPLPPASTTPEGVLTSGAQWLPWLDAYRTACIAPNTEIQALFEELRRDGVALHATSS